MNRPQKTYLVAPLDWGLGHATRCVPIIRLLLDKGQRVILAGSGLSLNYLKNEFPELEAVSLPGVKVEFETGQGFGLKTLLLGWKIRRYVSTELNLTRSLVRKYHIDVIISDNRYGVRCEGVRNILITHQLYPRLPILFRSFVHAMIRNQVGEFDQCWIPDNQSENENENDNGNENENENGNENGNGNENENENGNGNENVNERLNLMDFTNNEQTISNPVLSGDLSHGEDLPENTHYIGHLSRYQAPAEIINKDIDILAILSGPEPARSDFERILRRVLPQLNGTKVLICGKEVGNETAEDSLRIISGAMSADLRNYIVRSKKIICRSGYSSLMDLVALNRSALIVPTPGQSEQEYLSHYLSEKKWFVGLSQDQVESKLSTALENIPDTLSFAPHSLQKVKWLLNLDETK